MLEGPQNNKMMDSAPAKKQWFFSGSGVHFAKTIFAETIQEAEKIWHETKQLISAVPTSTNVQPTEQKPSEEVKNII